MPVKTTIQRARFRLIGVSASAMKEVATGLQESIVKRILSGRNTSDAPARPLSNRKSKGRWSYAYAKSQKHPPAVRNLRYTGFTMSQARVISAGPNTATIGFTDAIRPGGRLNASQIIAINNQRDAQYGVSPQDRALLALLVAKYPKVVIEKGSRG
jgi:hypothetical protein